MIKNGKPEQKYKIIILIVFFSVHFNNKFKLLSHFHKTHNSKYQFVTSKYGNRNTKNSKTFSVF